MPLKTNLLSLHVRVPLQSMLSYQRQFESNNNIGIVIFFFFFRIGLNEKITIITFKDKIKKKFIHLSILVSRLLLYLSVYCTNILCHTTSPNSLRFYQIYVHDASLDYVQSHFIPYGFHIVLEFADLL